MSEHRDSIGDKAAGHRVLFDPHARYGFITATCICGWHAHHKREAVARSKAERHLAKRGVAA